MSAVLPPVLGLFSVPTPVALANVWSSVASKDRTLDRPASPGGFNGMFV